MEAVILGNHHCAHHDHQCIQRTSTHASMEAHRSAACLRSASTLAMIAWRGGTAAGPLVALLRRCTAASTFSACSCSSFAPRACASGVAASRACKQRRLGEVAMDPPLS